MPTLVGMGVHRGYRRAEQARHLQKCRLQGRHFRSGCTGTAI